ncbi:hypothetical protein ScPMuIL_002972 [Solemya velum]
MSCVHLIEETMAEEICVVCTADCHGSGRKIGSKGLSTLSEASKKREDSLHLKLSSASDFYVHNSCYKTYTLPRNIANALDADSSMNVGAYVTRGLEYKPYDYETHCLICANEIDLADVQRHPGRKQARVSSIEVVDKEKKILIQKSLLDACEKRQDPLVIDVKARINFAGDLRAAKYQVYAGILVL